MNDYHLYARVVSEERFASRSERHLDRPVNPRTVHRCVINYENRAQESNGNDRTIT